MDVLKAIRIRRSIRRYKPETIVSDKLEMILESARLAPSADNRQPWHFVLVQEVDRKGAVAEAADDQMFMKDASVIVVAVGDPEVSSSWHEKDTMIALEHMALAATALGYGTCWIGAFDEDRIKQMLKIPVKMKVVALLPVGVPDEKPRARTRKELSEIFFKEEWQNPWTTR